MKINNVKINYGVTKNMGNYESLRIDLELSASVGEDEAPAKVVDLLYQQSKIEVARMVANKIESDDFDDIY